MSRRRCVPNLWNSACQRLSSSPEEKEVGAVWEEDAGEGAFQAGCCVRGGWRGKNCGVGDQESCRTKAGTGKS